MRRRGMPLMRAAATTAVVAGTAGAVSPPSSSRSTQGKRRQHSNSKIKPISRVWLTRRLNNRLRPPAAPPPPAAAPAAPDLTAQLQQLAQLHTAGVLSDEEFAAAKQKLLAG